MSWTVVTFTLLERVRPRHHDHPDARRIAIAAGLLAVDAAIAQALAAGADLPAGRGLVGWLVAELLHYAVHRAMHRGRSCGASIVCTTTPRRLRGRRPGTSTRSTRRSIR